MNMDLHLSTGVLQKEAIEEVWTRFYDELSDFETRSPVVAVSPPN